MTKLALVLAGGSLLAGCAATLSKDAVRGFEALKRGEAALANQHFRSDAGREDQNFVLHNLRLASAAQLAGNAFESEQALRRASRIMTSDIGKERGLLSLISSEQLKIFKGEPFEKAMVFFYLGVHYYNLQDFDNARASFQQALLMDAQSEPGYREDLRLVYFMLAKTFLKLNDHDNARLSMKKANGRRSDEPYPTNRYYDLELAKRANLTVLIEQGVVPLKVRQGPGGSLDSFAPVAYRRAPVEVIYGDQTLGQTSLGLDLAYEAAHRGSSAKDVVQGTKGVVRDAAIVTAAVSDDKSVQAGALLVALLNQSEADVRQWELLPGDIEVLSAKVEVPPSQSTVRQTLQLRTPLPGQQVWYYLPIDAKRERVYLFRLAPSRRE